MKLFTILITFALATASMVQTAPVPVQHSAPTTLNDHVDLAKRSESASTTLAARASLAELLAEEAVNFKPVFRNVNDLAHDMKPSEKVYIWPEPKLKLDADIKAFGSIAFDPATRKWAPGTFKGFNTGPLKEKKRKTRNESLIWKLGEKIRSLSPGTSASSSPSQARRSASSRGY